MKEKIYKKNWFIILMLIFIFPVGLFLMWYYKKFNITIRILLTILVVSAYGIFLLDTPDNDSTSNSISIETTETTTEQQTEITTEYSTNDVLLSFYLDNVSNVSNAKFDDMQNISINYANANNLKIETTKPTSDALGTIKLKKSDDNCLYMSFYPNTDNIETLSTIEYEYNNNISISTTNNANFYINNIEYHTRNTSNADATKNVANVDAQIEFLNSIKQ